MKTIKTFENFLDDATKQEMLSNDIEKMVRDMAPSFINIQSANVKVEVDDKIIQLSVSYDGDVKDEVVARWNVTDNNANIAITISENGKTLDHQEYTAKIGSVKSLIEELDKATGKSFDIEKRFLK